MPRSADPRRPLHAKRGSGRRLADKLTAQLVGGGLFLLLLPVVMARLPVPIQLTGLHPLGWTMLLLGLGALAITALRWYCEQHVVNENF